MKTSIFLIFSTLLVVWGYDFSDSHYNELLMQDLIDAADITGELEYVHPRHRRDVETVTATTAAGDVSAATTTTAATATSAAAIAAEDDEKKCKPHRSYKCCNDDSDPNKYGKMKELKRQCFQEIRGTDRTLNSKAADGDGTTMDLLSHDKNLVDEKGDVIIEKAKGYIKENVSSAAWQKDILNGVLDKCVAEAADKKAKQVEPTKCNPFSSYFVYCVWRELTLACPVDKQDQSKKCIKLREKFTKNEQVPFKPDFEE